MKKQIQNDCVCFTAPSKLFAHMEQCGVDVVFMDLKFSNACEDGIKWSKHILKKFPRTIVIILTAYEERYKEGYVARAFRFMTKPIVESELFDNLQSCLEELQLTRTIPLIRWGISQNILIQDICYLSAQSGGSELWTKSDVYYCEESLL